MPDISGAIAAINARLASNWTTTRIVYPNVTPADPWPPTQGKGVSAGQLAPWVLLEVVNTTSNLRAVGEPGNQFWLYEGLIHAHVFVPLGYGQDGNGENYAHKYASQIGDIFRNASFYTATQGYQVKTISPRIDGGESQTSDYGTYFRVTSTIPFEYYHRG